MARWKMAVAMIAGALLAATSDAATTSSDPAARGLDAFVHVPSEAPAGGVLPLQATAYGFPTVVALVPLEGATVEAAWDPRSLGPGVAVAPPPVRATAGVGGRVHLAVPVPTGDARELSLLLSVRADGHERTRALAVRRTRAREVALHVNDTRVVPGGAATAFAIVTDATTGRPLAKARVELELLEGGVARFHREASTDAAGSAMVRVPIPATDDPAWSWTLRASLADGAAANVTLVPREETPGQPVLRAAWDAPSVRAGAKASLRVSVRDASDEPVASLPLRYWVGPSGTEPPKDEERWRAVSTAAETDASGVLVAEVSAPTTVPPDGTTLFAVVKGTVEGHELVERTSIAVGSAAPSVEVVPEAGALVPGLEQRVALRVRDAEGDPVVGGFALEGDGLRAHVTTDARGDAEVLWRVPLDVGARREVGPCAGDVAATVSVRADEGTRGLGDRVDPFQSCVRVDRDATAIVRAARPVVRAGEPFHVEVAGGGGAPWSLAVEAQNGAQAASVWLDDGARGGEVRLPDGAHGIFTLSAASPGGWCSPNTDGPGTWSPEGSALRPAGKAVGVSPPGLGPRAPNCLRAARVVAGTVLALPEVLPKLDAAVVAGRAAPGGTVDVEARLTDSHGAPLAGTVAGVLIDLYGGASSSPFGGFDARHALAGALVDRDADVDPFLEADGAWDATRRAALAGRAGAPLAPMADPAGTARDDMQKAFAEVVRSVEGAVFEASQSPERLRDVRRKTPAGWAFNPELLTLATAAMDHPPETPGGEPLTLADLIAVDPQVSFDHVARRIARLKLFRVLAAVRSFVRERQLDPDEPAMKDPNAMLRRLVRDGRIASDLLLDPWGGTMRFRATNGPRIPFLSVFHGYELAAPGPDGALGTGDDVRDPFERVLRSGTPYAKAVEEDRIVDAKWDMQVSDETVSGWESMFDELTGTALGEGIGLGSIGTIGHGSGGGAGVGYGRGAGGIAGRGSVAVARGLAFFAAPTRTDADGKVRLHVPLGDVETTWRLALVAIPDHAMPATTTLDVPVSLPMSARVEAGARWVAGDEVDVLVSVRNRTQAKLATTVAAEAGGVAALEGARTARVEVPAGGAAKTTFRVRAAQAGGATLRIVAHADGAPDDVVTHAWQVEPAGEKTDVTSVAWIDCEGDVALDARDATPLGPARLVLERGPGPSLAAALEALDPDRLGAPGALADALEVASRVRAFALARGGEGDPLAVRASAIAKRALGRLFVVADREDPGGALFAPLARARAWAPAIDVPIPAKWAACPADGAVLALRLDALDAEPPPVGAAVEACWDALVGGTLEQVMASHDPVAVSRALLALAERPHRRQEVAPLADRLRELVQLRPSGGIVLQGALATDREARSLVLAALLRATYLGHGAVASSATLAAWLEVQRDGHGSYGSPLATRSAVRAILAGPLGDATPAKAFVKAGAAEEVALDVPASGTAVVALAAGVTRVHVRAKGVVARLERPVLRPWTQPLANGASPVHVDVVWPADAKAGTTGKLLVSLRHDLARAALVDVRLPLPPGVTLAAPMSRVRQLQGVLAIRTTVAASTVTMTIPVPVRFGLSGRVTVPEGEGRLADEAAARGVVAARGWSVR